MLYNKYMELNQKINTLIALSFVTLLGVLIALLLLTKLSQEIGKSDNSPREQYQESLTTLYQTL
jgi:hypothetical protein